MKLKQSFPPDLDYVIALDTTLSVTEGITEIQHTLFEALVLVIIVVFISSFVGTSIGLLQFRSFAELKASIQQLLEDVVQYDALSTPVTSTLTGRTTTVVTIWDPEQYADWEAMWTEHQRRCTYAETH